MGGAEENEMGWMFGWSSKQGLVEHLLKQDGGNCSVVKHSIVGNNLWCLMQRKVGGEHGEKFVCLFKLQAYRSNGNVEWGYKDIDESMGPCETNCPQYLIDAADAPAGYAAEWREQVKKAREAKRGKASKAFLEGLKRGDTFYYNGEPIMFLYWYERQLRGGKSARRIAGMPGRGGTYRYPISKISATA